MDAKKTSRNVYHKYVRDLLVDNISMVSAIMDIEAKTVSLIANNLVQIL